MKSLMTFGVAVVAAGGLLLACGDNSAIPVVQATPTPIATPTPTPTPLSVYNFPCFLPPSGVKNPDTGVACRRDTPRLSTQVNAALDQVIAEHPDYFNLSDVSGSSPRIVKGQEYLLAVATNLQKMGVCMKYDNEEIAVKISNTWNEQWNIYTGAGYMRRRYETICEPSWW
jgi:hypothetical protein